MTEKKVFNNSMFHIIPVSILRQTPSVLFNNVPIIDNLSAIDYVEHGSNAISPAIAGRDNETFWYMHTHQEDNLLVLRGTRLVELYTKENGKIETFIVTKDYVKHEGKIIHEGMSLFGWPKFVFHRVNSAEDGSQSINYASYYGEEKSKKDEIMKTNFNIYSLNTITGEYLLAREGSRDQPNKK